MFTTEAVTFANLTEAVRSILARCEYAEQHAAEKAADKNRGCASDRIRWNLLSHVSAVIQRETVDELLSQHADLAEAIERGEFSGAEENAAAVEIVIRWAHYCFGVIDSGVNGRADLADQIVEEARVKNCRKILEALGVVHHGMRLSDDDMRAVYADRARREADRKGKPARAELIKEAGIYLVNVFDGYGTLHSRLGLCSRNKGGAKAEAAQTLTAAGLAHLIERMK
jgi:hypothetical protein